jgi:hypothetical protein
MLASTSPSRFRESPNKVTSRHIFKASRASFSLDSQFRSINSLYTKPYTRIGAYFAGVWVGYYLSKINRQWNIRKVSYPSHCAAQHDMSSCAPDFDRLAPLLRRTFLFISLNLLFFLDSLRRAWRMLHDLHQLQSLCLSYSFSAIESLKTFGCLCCFQRSEELCGRSPSAS